VRRLPSARAARRTLVIAAAAVIAVAATPTLAAFTATITANGDSTAASLVLTTTPAGGSTCTSTGGTNTPFTSDSASCNGSVWASAELSSSASTSLATTFASVGTGAPAAATLTSGTAGTEVAADVSGNGDDAFPIHGVTFGANGPLSAAAVSLDGSTGMLETEQAINDPGPNLSLAAWFKVANGYASGGGIIGFQNSQRGTPSDHDRMIWMDNSGHICAGEYNGSAQSGCSATTYNNGAWHYVVASFNSSSGLILYVDNSSVATNTSATAGQNYVGWWTIGYSNETNWSPVPASSFLAGSLAEVAVFPSALSSFQVSTLYGSGSGSESSFETRVTGDSPSAFWPLQSASSTANLPVVSQLPDISGNNNLGTPQGGVTASDSGPFSSSAAMYFNGTSSSWVETTTNVGALATSFSVAVWFRAPAGWSSGGGIMTDDNSQTGGGTNYDPIMWMDNSGRIVAGSYTGVRDEATSSAAYNDGKWHFAVMTVSSSLGLSLYVDGAAVATNGSGTQGGNHTPGYWIIGEAFTGSWSDTPTNAYWTGDLAHFAYFPTALSASQVSTLSGAGSVGAFETQMLADGPSYYWPLTDSGTTESELDPFFAVAPDVSGNNDDATAVGSTVTFGTPGPLSGGDAAALTGASGMLETEQAINDPGPNLSLAAWFKVANGYASGGGIIGFQNSQQGTPSDHDRMIWMDNSGHICAGEYNGSAQSGCSATTYNNGAWHYVVASFNSSSGLILYVDNSSVATNTSATAGQNYVGWWTIGYSNETNWSPVPASSFLAGSLAEVAVFPSALSSFQVSTLYGSGSGSESSFETRVTGDSPSAFWPLAASASAPTETGGVEMSVQAANNGTTTCLFPAGAGACPSLGESDLVPTATTRSLTAPTASHSTTVTLAGEDSSAPPTAFSGLHFLIPLTFAGTNSSWTASLAYGGANVQL
jgi:hypothetical protein